MCLADDVDGYEDDDDESLSRTSVTEHIEQTKTNVLYYQRRPCLMDWEDCE